MGRACHGCHKFLSPDETSYIKDGVIYCCSACARNTGCTCARDGVAEGLVPPADDRDSRAFPLTSEQSPLFQRTSPALVGVALPEPAIAVASMAGGGVTAGGRLR